MPVTIHNQSYKTVAERLNEAHAADDLLEVQTEVLYIAPQVMVKATIETKKGIFTGISAANPKKSIEAQAAVEVAETSAVGRALAFAGYAGSEIASADEVVKALTQEKTTIEHGKDFVNEMLNENLGTCSKCGAPMKMSKAGRPYCSALCWRNPTPTPVADTEIPH